MEGENGILQDPEVEELLRQFETFEIFTDDPTEGEYNALQREHTGYNANPTYIVLDSKNLLEVARFSFTNSKEDFVAFLRKGLTNEPAFASQIRFTGIEIQENGEDVEVLKPKGVLVADEGTVETYGGDDVRVYRRTFSGSQTFVVQKDLDGEYPLTAHLITGIYQGDERLQTISVSDKVYFTVID